MKYVFNILLSIFIFGKLMIPEFVNASEIPLFRVLKVVDGDTIVVDVRGNRETVRLLGIDTPESVDPRKTVQCFGKAATDKMKSFVSGKSVILVDEKLTQGNRDKYKRLLRYVYLPDSVRTFVNGEMIRQGFAFSYREYPTKMMNKFNTFEDYARERNIGLWGSCPLILGKSAVKGVKAASPLSTSVSDKDCTDFRKQKEAQEYFELKGGSSLNNIDRLDSDSDGVVCESLP